MNNNAKLIYDSLKQFHNIKDLIGKTENRFLDFKESSSRQGKMSGDDKKNFSKAASGFAHSDGGVIVWGIKATKNADGVDQALELCPIQNIEKFYQVLNSYVKDATEPAVEGIEHKIIKEKKQNSDGFIVSFFPKSMYEHRVYGKSKNNGFYKRFGDSFVSLGTSDIKALFLRSVTPDLTLKIKSDNYNGILISHTIILENIGKGIAKYFGVDVHTNLGVNAWYDSEGNNRNKIASIITKRGTRGDKLILAQNGIVIHPKQEISIAIFSLPTKGEGFFEFNVYAENMLAKKDKKIFKKGVLENNK